MKKLFTNDKFFLAMVLCAVVCNVIFSVIAIVVYNRPVAPKLQLILRVLCAVGLYFSYRFHSKNVMKALMGALLMGQLTTAISLLTGNINFITPAAVFSVLSFLLFVNHLIINSDHHSSPVMVRINQILVILLVVNQAIWSYFGLSKYPLLNEFCNFFGFVGLSAVVVCVESRLDAYRLDRENAGWTEEKGYPKDYVHAYEKNKK